MEKPTIGKKVEVRCGRGWQVAQVIGHCIGHPPAVVVRLDKSGAKLVRLVSTLRDVKVVADG